MSTKNSVKKNFRAVHGFNDYHDIGWLNDLFKEVGVDYKVYERDYDDNAAVYIGVIYSGPKPSKKEVTQLVIQAGLI